MLEFPFNKVCEIFKNNFFYRTPSVLLLKALKFSFSTIKGLSLKSYVSGGKIHERHNKSSVR